MNSLYQYGAESDLHGRVLFAIGVECVDAHSDWAEMNLHGRVLFAIGV